MSLNTTIAEKERNFLKRNQSALLRVLGLGLVLAIGYTVYVSNKTTEQLSNTAKVLTPQQTADFANTSVRITTMTENSGGTGVVLKSTDSGSTILTNKHVCNVIKTGGLVLKNNSKYVIKDYKTYSAHDLCMLRITKNLRVNTSLAKEPPAVYTEAIISGHPSLLPHVLSKGSFSDDMVITVLTGVKKCQKDSKSIYCMLFGVDPIIESFNTTLVTGLIMPGSSGSAVFNASGEISALIFAGSRGLSYGFVVPYENVRDFVNRELTNSDGWVTPSTDAAGADEETQGSTKFNVVVKINNRTVLNQEQIKTILNENFKLLNK